MVRPRGADAPTVSADKGPRLHRAVAYAKPARLDTAGLVGWRAIWDQDTDVPLRMWGRGELVVNAISDGAAAEAAARAFLAKHLKTLAPGASVADFELVSNQLSPDGEIRSVGFAQRVHGMRVVGGSIGFAFKRDRLALVSSTALPHVTAAAPTARLSSTALEFAAKTWLAKDGHDVRLDTVANLLSPGAERVVVPVVRPRIGLAPDISYRVAEPVSVAQNDGPGRWNVWLDAADGTPIVRASTIRYASGKVLFDVPDRGPQGTRTGKAASFATHTIDGAAVTADLAGNVTWAGNAASTVDVKLAGTFVTISNKAGAVFTEQRTLAPNGTITVSRPTDEIADAQIDAYVYANQAKEFARTRVNPALDWVDQRLVVSVNENQTCNAFSTGDDIHFFRKGQQCENTGRLADVVYHEFGHSLHANSIIDGVGQFDGALSEGISDVYATLITGDPGMGRGFFFTNNPLRNLAPTNPLRWPEDTTGEVHDDGEIIGGTLWDLRVALEAELGAQAALEKSIKIFYTIMQRAADIPSSFPEALLADDDDGDLLNGTPNQCAITAAFGRHGLADPTVTLGIKPPTRADFNVTLDATAPATACPGAPTVQSVALDWQPRGGQVQQIAMSATGATYAGAIPAQPDGTVVQYKVTVTLTDGSQLAYPQNAADPFYEFYVGQVTTLYCADFENGAADWTHSAMPANRDEWEAGPPLGLGGDPKVAHGGSNVFGFDLSRDGVYGPSTASSFAETPEIDLQGNTKVRLQYYRWLGVEDGFYDQAKITVNGMPVWTNFTSQVEPQQAGINHIDREWRFQDVDLSAHAANGKIKLRFELGSDQGLELGGWNLDDVCIVALAGPALTCGNSAVDEGETCDDGNRVDGDGCSANCVDETGGSEGGGCCSANDGPTGAFALSVATFGFVMFGRRRRRK